ncbi:MAG: hypothetical protein GX549_09610, partial [Clostridiales bacterium]|nr:hypothetical protein [Clostridiales bacterium]
HDPVVERVREMVDAEFAAGRNTLMGDEEMETMVRMADPDFYNTITHVRYKR